VFRQLIEEGVTECSDLAEEMKVSKATISRFAQKGKAAGWLKMGRGGAAMCLLVTPDGVNR